MRTFFEKRITYVVAIAYFIIALLAFRDALFSPNSIGLLHDWILPLYPEQTPQVLSSAISAWNPASLGYYAPAADVIFRIFFGVTSSPNIALWIKIMLIACLFIAGFSMYWLLLNYFRASKIAAACAGLFYMLTPVIFSRVIVGYYYYLIGYALLPIIFLSFVTGVRDKSFTHLIFCGVLFGFAASQIQFVVLVPILLILYIIFNREYFIRGIIALGFIIVIFCLVQFPLVVYYVSSTLIHEPSFNQMVNTAQYIWIYFFSPQISDALMLFGKDYEFLFLQYFQNKILFIPFLVCAVLLPIIAFSIFRNKRAQPFVILAILTLIFMLGINPPFGIIYQWAYEKIPLAGLFRTSYHWAALLAFSYAVLLGMALDQISRVVKKRNTFSQWIRDAIIVIGGVFIIYLNYIFLNFPSLSNSLEKRGIPFYSIIIGLCICIILLLIIYLKPDIILSRLVEKKFWQEKSRMILCFLFLAMILIYSWPFFSGNFSGRLQVYTYDREYQDLYSNLQQESGDYRVLWLPMISPIQYKEYQYPGQDSLISYSPKLTFPQNIAMFSKENKYTAYIANLQYTQNTEYFGDILSLFSTKYIIYRNDFTAVLPDYLAFGSVPDFVWNKSQPYIFLQHQKDIKNTNNNDRYSLWENTVRPRISVQIPFAVAGDLSTTIGLSYARPLLNYDQIPALIYIEDANTPGSQDLAKTVIIDGGRSDDLFFSYVNSSYLYDAGWYTKEIDARKGWTTTFNWWWYDTSMSAQPEYGAFTLASNSTISVNPQLLPGNYSVFIKARSGPNSNNLTYYLNSLSGTVTIPNDIDTYSWYLLGNYSLTNTNLTIRSYGRSEIERFAFVPESEFMSAKNKAASYIDNRSIVIFYEAENFNTTYARQAFGTSRGYIEIPERTNVSFVISIPKTTEYTEYIRIRSENQSSVIVTIDTIQYTMPLSPSDEFTWITLTNTTLSNGLHSISLQSEKPLDFDTLVLKSTDYQNAPLISTVNYTPTSIATWTDPTHFLVTVDSEKPVLLVFNENYHPAWKLTSSTGYSFNHYQVNYYANAYYVNNSGNGPLNLKFTYQDTYFDTIIISLVSLIILISIIVVGRLYTKK